MPSTTFGASIVPTSDEQRAAPLLDRHSPAMTPVPSHDSLAQQYGDNVPVQSPFYTHPPASHEAISPEKKTHLNVYEKDLEAANDAPLTPSTDEDHPFSKRIGVEQHTEDTMWPSKQALQQRHRAEKQQRRQQKGIKLLVPVRERWAALSKRTKLIAKLLLGLFIIGIAVGLGVGISKAVQGSYYVKDGSSKPIDR
ncbi:hypothetical protein CERZMDRAFT_99998 [Cercospora zeae-maydis SCOH1-5]|uniref:Uncharacterized protein n=1 Tax=Cercospora zeae-maydis SCOH1-5 TaxID=717836 RepID=A0A6A6F965_9PEZI|nr:hypothetical protein CERZMDRAFT_99998 [Cercospora zeae-maydis SCOH1-5]